MDACFLVFKIKFESYVVFLQIFIRAYIKPQFWEWKFNFAKENIRPKSKSYFFSFSLSPTIFVFPLLPPHSTYNRLKNNCVITFSTQEIWLTARGQETPRKARWIDKYYISSCVIVLVFCQHLWEIYIGHDHWFQIIRFPLKAPQFSNWETI